MRHAFIGIILIAIGFVTIYPAVAQEYDTLDRQIFYRTPSVCAYEDMSDVMMDKTRNAVLEWEGKMKATEKFPKDQVVWEIDYRLIPSDEIDTFDLTKCDITISFFDRPLNQDDWYDIIGYTFYPDEDNPRIDIEIYYEALEFCVTRSSDANYIYTDYTLCYNGKTKPTSELISTVSHEFGHALGLGHYTTFNENRHESIMTPYEFDNPRLQIITPGDVEALLSIYGTEGYVSEWANPDFLWPQWMTDSLFELYYKYEISGDEMNNAMKWYYLEAELAS